MRLTCGGSTVLWLGTKRSRTRPVKPRLAGLAWCVRPVFVRVGLLWRRSAAAHVTMRGRPPASPSMGISQQGGYDGYSGPGQQHMRSVVTNKPGVGGEDAILITPLLSDDRTQPPKQQTSFPRAVFLLMNAILGSACTRCSGAILRCLVCLTRTCRWLRVIVPGGILGQPYAASQSGAPRCTACCARTTCLVDMCLRGCHAGHVLGAASRPWCAVIIIANRAASCVHRFGAVRGVASVHGRVCGLRHLASAPVL